MLRNGVGDLVVGLCGWRAARVGRGCRLSLFIPSDSDLPHPFLRPLHSRLGTRPTTCLCPAPQPGRVVWSLRGDGRGGQASAPQVGLAPAQPPSSWEESGPLVSAGDWGGGGGGAGRSLQPLVFSDPRCFARVESIWGSGLGTAGGLLPWFLLGVRLWVLQGCRRLVDCVC